MSTIRRHGVAFHLIPTPGDDLWLEVIRESDGAVLVNEVFRGEGEAEFAPAVEEWFDDIVRGQVDQIDIPRCRVCDCRRRELPRSDSGHLLAEAVVEWEFDLCPACASHLEQSVPWMRGFLAERYVPDADESDDNDW